MLWKTRCPATTTKHLLLDNWQFGWLSHLSTLTLLKSIHTTLNKAGQSWHARMPTGSWGFAPTNIRANDTSRPWVEQFAASWAAAQKACEAMAYCRDKSCTLADGCEWYVRVLTDVIWPDETATVKVAKEVSCTFPFAVKTWVVEEYAEESLCNRWCSGTSAPATTALVSKKRQHQLHSSLEAASCGNEDT